MSPLRSLRLREKTVHVGCAVRTNGLLDFYKNNIMLLLALFAFFAAKNILEQQVFFNGMIAIGGIDKRTGGECRHPIDLGTDSIVLFYFFQ